MILKSLDAELVQGDLLEAHSLRRAVAGIDTIIHLGAVAEESGMRFASFRPPHVFGARSLFFEEARKGRILFGATAHGPRSHDSLDSDLYSVGAVRSWNLYLPVETGTLSNLLSIYPLEMVFFGQKIPLFYSKSDPKIQMRVTGTVADGYNLTPLEDCKSREHPIPA